MMFAHMKSVLIAAGASQVSGHFWQGSHFDQIKSGQAKWFEATMETMGIVARMGFADKSGGGTANTDFSQQPGASNDISDPEAQQILKDGTASSQNIHATVSDDGTFTFHNDGGCGTENGGSGFSVWDGNCGGPAGKSIWGDGSDLDLPPQYADGCAVMCGDKKCSDIPGTKSTVWDDLCLSSSTLNPAFSQGLSMCPGFYTWPAGGDGSADGSVCTYNNANLVQDENTRRKVKAGQKYPAMYSMVANHMGSFTYIMVDARCGDKKECFDTSSENAQNEYKPVVLQFDDDCTLPTFQNRVRIVEPTGQGGGTYAPLVQEGYDSHPSWSAGREGGWYFGDEGSPYGAEYIKIPRDTPAGKYTVMLKWETSGEQRIFASCSDIEVESSCDDDHCTSCPSDTSVCTGCAEGYSLSGSKCEAIHCSATKGIGAHCSVCTDATHCKTCKAGYTGSSAGLCDKCAPGLGWTGRKCNTCSTGYKGDNCDECATNYFKNEDGECVEKTCSNKFPHCASCNEKLTKCTKCQEGYDGPFPNCKPHVDPSAGGKCDIAYCTSCNDWDKNWKTDGVIVYGCQWPNQPTADKKSCKSCAGGYDVFDHGSYANCGQNKLEGCKTACQSGWGKDCPVGHCQTCIDGFTLDKETGLCTAGSQPSGGCQDGEYRDGEHCKPCKAIKNCYAITCTNASDSKCGKCNHGFTPSASKDKCHKTCGAGKWYDESRSGCEDCHKITNCKAGHLTCSSETDQTCDMCNSGFQPNADGTKCIVACGDNEYYNESTGHCVKCSGSIAHCEAYTCSSASDATCQTCDGKLVPVSGGSKCGTAPVGPVLNYSTDFFATMAGDASPFCSWSDWSGASHPAICGGGQTGFGGGACDRVHCIDTFSFDSTGTWIINTDGLQGRAPGRSFAYMSGLTDSKFWAHGAEPTFSFDFISPQASIDYIKLLFWTDGFNYLGVADNTNCADKSTDNMYLQFFPTSDNCGKTSHTLKIEPLKKYKIFVKFSAKIHIGVTDENHNILTTAVGGSRPTEMQHGPQFGLYAFDYTSRLSATSVDFKFGNVCMGCYNYDSVFGSSLTTSAGFSGQHSADRIGSHEH